MYVWVAARFYFLLSFVDAYSRYVVHHKLLMSLDGKSVATELQAALEAAARRQAASRSRSRQRVRQSRCRGGDQGAQPDRHQDQPRHPESNGIVERFNGTVRAESDDDYGNNYLQAEAIIAKLMHHYNEERLHAALGYMTPATWHRGQAGRSSRRACAANRCGPCAS